MIGGLHHMDESKHRLDRLGGHEPKATTKTTRRAALAVSRQVSPTQRCVPERKNREQILFDTADAVRDKSFDCRSYKKAPGGGVLMNPLSSDNRSVSRA